MSEARRKRASAAGFIEFQNARHPSGEGSWTVRISREAAESLSVHGPVWRYHALLDVPALLFEPDCIFRCLELEDSEEFFCYVGRPRLRRRQDGTTEPTPDDRALFVFLSEGGTILRWRWEAVESDQPLHESCGSRFGTLRWART